MFFNQVIKQARNRNFNQRSLNLLFSNKSEILKPIISSNDFIANINTNKNPVIQRKGLGSAMYLVGRINLKSNRLPGTSVRYFSSSSNDNQEENFNIDHSNFDNLNDGSSFSNAVNDVITNSTVTDIATSIPATGIEALDLYASSQLIMYCIEQIHQVSHLPYWNSIVLGTLALRIFLFPLQVKSMKNTARMAFLKPDLDKLQSLYMKDPNFQHDPAKRLEYQKLMQELFSKHKVNPIRSFIVQLIPLPIFISIFWGLRDFQNFFPAYKEGGDFWFTDLSIPDP